MADPKRTPQQFSTDHGIVDDKDNPIVRAEAPAETPEQRAQLDSQVDAVVGQSGERKFGKPPA